MIRFAFTGDTHAVASDRWEEHCRIMTWLASDMRARKVNLVAHCGDVYHARSTLIERSFIADWTREVADFAPLAIVAGNHDHVGVGDEIGDVAMLGRLSTVHPVYAAERPAAFAIAGCSVGMVPWPRKANLLAALGKPVAHEQSNAIAAECLRDVYRGMGALMARNPGPRLLLTHAMIDGARTDHDQPIVGADMAVSVADLALARATFTACSHVHAAQEWTFDGAPFVYAGSPRSCNFGEPGAKSYVIAEFEDDGRFISWERVPTPSTPLLLLESTFADGLLPVDPSVDVRGAEIRLRYTVDADAREGARRAAEALRDAWTAQGAVSVKVEPIVRSILRARAPEVARARTMRDKVEAFWTATSRTVEEPRRARLLGRLAQIEVDP